MGVLPSDVKPSMVQRWRGKEDEVMVFQMLRMLCSASVSCSGRIPFNTTRLTVRY